MINEAVLPYEEALEIIGDPKTAFPEVSHRGEPPLHSLEDRIPRFNLMELKNIRDSLRIEWQDSWHRKECDSAFVQDVLMVRMRGAVPARISDDNLLGTLNNHVLGKSMNKMLWQALCVRIAGNMAWMRYKPLTDVGSVSHCQWAVLETLEAVRMKSKGGKHMAILEYRIRTGAWANCLTRKHLALNFLPMYGDCLGMGAMRWKKQPRLYVGTNLFAFLDPASRVENLKFSKIYGSSPCKQISRFYTKGRAAECGKGFNQACWYCPQALHGDADWQCKFATHQQPWIRRICDKCGKERWFYTEWPRNHLCLNCTEGRGR